MREWSLIFAAVSAAAVVVRLARGDVEATLARCCALGSNWAREDKACAEFPTPVAGEASEHQSICLTAAAICCLRLYREEQCEAGKQAAQRGRHCRLPATQGGEYYKDCCEGCKLGLVSGAMALSCSFSSLEFGFPWDIAYTQCCTHLHPQLPLLPREAPEDNSVLYPGSVPLAEGDNLCLQFPGQLCAHVCVPAPGSYTCQCRAGFVLSVDKKTCLQEEPVDRCADNDACEHICRDTGIAVVCACDPGFRLADDDRSCDDVDECTEGHHSCTPGTQVCRNQRGSYACVNADGSLTVPWVRPSPVSRGPLAVGLGPGNGIADLLGDPRDFLSGVSGPCPTGYRYSALSRVCDDVDECVTVPGLCGRGGLCANTIGSYTCTEMPPDTCPPGYSFDLPLQSCRDVDECTTGTDNCDRDTHFCINTQGSFACQQLAGKTSCPAGYKYNALNKACEDVNECAEVLSVCGADEVCRNTVGAYDCELRCDEGFLYSSGLRSCVDVDECLQGEHTCTPGEQVCVNEPGSYRCEGLLDATRIDDDRLLLALGGIRGVNASSVARGEVRECPAGYGFDFNSRQCLDIDECQGGVHHCDTATERCINTLGSFRCRRKRSCPVGLTKAASGECVDVDECEDQPQSLCLPGQVCVNTPGSFECQVECRDGFRYDPSHPLTCADIDECSNSPCSSDEVCLNTEGSFACRKPRHRHDSPRRKGQQGHSRRGSQPDRDRDRDRDRASTRPATRPGRNREGDRPVQDRDPCLPGYERPDEESECEDVDECESGAAQCLPEEVCLNHPGGYRCRVPPKRPRVCPPGHRYNPGDNDCVDVNECEERQDDCSSTAQTCVNSVGSYRCIDRSPTCSFGYRYDSVTRGCVDVDECLSSPCESEERCTNSLGSYECRCREGYKLDAGTARCKDVNECQLGTYDCGESQRCDNTVGSYTCVRISGCGTGYTLNHNNGLCEDVDECADSGLSNCRSNENCVNLLGSFSCRPKMVCGRGFVLNDLGTGCEDIDECATGAHECSGGQECHNRRGTYTCQCRPGYRLDRRRQCQDIDECTAYYGAACSSNAVCENTPGTFLCHCNDGFEQAEGGRNCIDVDECARDANVCHHRCLNIRGSYQCICNAGYNIASDNRTCIDVDECEETRLRGRGRLCVGVCENTPGSFQCTCPPGYTLSPDLRTCKDNNECERDSVCRGASEQCINTRGGFRCMEIACPAGYIRDTSHKSRCKKRSLYCRKDDLVCHRQPLSYSYNFLPLVSNMSLPSTGQVDMFTMRGPLWATSTVRFALELESVRSPTGVTPAVRESFILRRTSVNQAVISLQQQLEGPQEVQLALSMKLYHGNDYSGSAVAKLLIIISEYDF